jgi:hypothetical protein
MVSVNASDFVDRYWNLSVDADMPGAPFNATVSINKYLIATQGNIDQIRANQWAVISKARQKGITIEDGVAARLRNGKGSPDDMELILGAGVESGALKAEEHALQAWADHNLGVDCTGFVIAYLVEIGALKWNSTLNGGASCPWIYQTIAKMNWNVNKYASEPEIWNVGDIHPDDIILWMKSGGGPETKSPGHISLVVDKGDAGIDCAESNGSDDGDGHSGPRNTVRQLQKTQTGGGKKWWQLDNGIIVVRPVGS